MPMMNVLTILTALLTPLSAIVVKHNGRSHLHPKARRGGNSPVVGLVSLMPPPTVPDSNPPDTGSGATSARASPRPILTSLSIIPTPTIPPTISSYVFQSTVVQVPLATVCPDTPSSSAIFSILPVDSTFYNTTSITQRVPPNATEYIPVQVNATALLPNGSSTVFLSITTSTGLISATFPSASPPPLTNGPSAATARIILDGSGCQTLYTGLTIPLCRTTMYPPGMLPVPVTDCDQWVTFSTEKLDGCASPQYTIMWDALTSTSLDSSPTPVFGSETIWAPPTPRIAGPVAFYAAHWYELVQGPVPNIVRVDNCIPQESSTSPICQTSSESWSVSYDTSVIATSRVASFSGPALLTSGTGTFTTFLSFSTIVTTYQTITSSSIVRSRLPNEILDSTSPQTVTIIVTTTPTRTRFLEEAEKSTAAATVTITQTTILEAIETKTRTVSTTTSTEAPNLEDRQEENRFEGGRGIGSERWGTY